MKFDQIRRVRKAAHVTQEELAKRIGVNRALISKYETGIIEPSVSQLHKIASALGVPMMELLDLEEGAERIKRDENLIRKLSYEFDIPAEIIRRRAANKSSHTEIDALRKLVKAGSILDESKVSLQNDEPVQGVKKAQQSENAWAPEKEESRPQLHRIVELLKAVPDDQLEALYDIIAIVLKAFDKNG